jgi:tRNA A-37 threonylcarbamoyl transferase component Bud32
MDREDGGFCSLVATAVRADEKFSLSDSWDSKVRENGRGVHLLVPVGAVDVLEGVTDERGVPLLLPPHMTTLGRRTFDASVTLHDVVSSVRSIEQFKLYGMSVSNVLEVAVDGCTVTVEYVLDETCGTARIVANVADKIGDVERKLAAVLEQPGIKCVTEDGSVRERTSQPFWRWATGMSELSLRATRSSPLQSPTKRRRVAVGATDDGSWMQFFRWPRLGPMERLTIDGWSFVGQRTGHPSIHFMLAEDPGFRDIVELQTGSQSYVWLVRMAATGKLAIAKGTHVKGPPELREEFEREIKLLTSEPMRHLQGTVVPRLLWHGRLYAGCWLGIVTEFAGYTWSQWHQQQHDTCNCHAVVYQGAKVALAALHASGVVHGDIRMANVVYDPHCGHRVLLIDMGRAEIASSCDGPGFARDIANLERIKISL